MSPVSIAILIIAIVIAAAVVTWAFLHRCRRTTLQNRFGPEYDRAVHSYGGRTRAEKELQQRARRIEKYHIRPLTPEEQQRFSENWRSAQSRFVDDPAHAICEADNLVIEAMRTRGYPMSDFERRAQDLSVDHPQVVRNYRGAHAIALAQNEGRASTEDLRQAMVLYRDLFDELLETHTAGTPQ